MKKQLLGAAAVVVLTLGVLTPAAAAHRSVVPATAKLRVGLGVIAEVNDQGFNALAYTGLKMAHKRLGTKGTLIVAPNGGDYVSALNTFVSKHYPLVIAVGALWDNAVYRVAKANPKTRFAVVDGMPVDNGGKPAALSNVTDLFFRSQQPGYIVGVLAGLMEKKKVGAAKHNTIGMLGALPLPFITAQMCGYLQGARSVDKSVTVLSAFANTFIDPKVGKNYGEQHIAKGADILFGVADATGLGYLSAAQEHHRYGIGFAADQGHLGKYVLTSAEVGVQTAVFRTIRADLKGKLTAGPHYYSLRNGGVGYATNDMHHVPAKIRKIVAKRAAQVKSGKLKVPATCSLPK